MGAILCEKHGKSFIVQMSNKLHESFLKDGKEEILKLIFRVEELNEDFVYFFSKEDDISGYKDIMDLNLFEEEFSKISSNPVVCITCFEDYLKMNNNKITEKVFLVKSEI
ncbi:hypothetical protein [Aquimarina sp. Aq78]|uniref:hypothetical protein n=1 Tax=Aquimarina sp. Aq78 TaxID=1191889 RepID=UPI000D0EDFAE|nr:hypothetical protein [Aquimarina sp. Aq78]